MLMEKNTAGIAYCYDNKNYEQALADDYVLDLSNIPFKGIENGYKLKDSLVEIDLTHNQIYRITNINHVTGLKKLCLRQNLIRVIEGLNGLNELEYLDLYDNKIDEIPVSSDPEPNDGEKKWIYGLNLPSLTYLDLCFNNIVHIENLDRVPKLKSLYFAQNAIRVIKGLSELSELCTLELGANRIRKIEGLNHLKKLENLWLGKNKITQIDGLSELTNLKILSLQNNRITKIENLSGLVNLQELYLSFNGIVEVEGLEQLTKLKILDLSHNRISALHTEAFVGQREELEDLWLNDNKIASLEDACALVKSFAKLQTVYLEANLIVNPSYRIDLIKAQPRLEQIDADDVNAEERRLANK